jgi:hypothetical protein
MWASFLKEIALAPQPLRPTQCRDAVCTRGPVRHLGLKASPAHVYLTSKRSALPCRDTQDSNKLQKYSVQLRVRF